MVDLKQQSQTLIARFKEIRVKYPDIKGHIFAKDDKQDPEKKIVVNLFHLYDQKHHHGRRFESCGNKTLAELTLQEARLISMVMVELAGEEFDIVLYEFIRGYFTYYLLLKA